MGTKRKGSVDLLYDVFFIDEKEGWCVGSDGCILHTRDGGINWERQESNIDSVLFSVKFLNHLEGWIAGYGIVLHTIDGGKKWEVKNDLKEWFVDIDFFDETYGLLIEHYGNVYQTTNRGEDWRRLSIAEKSILPLTSVAIINKTEAWIAGNNGLGYTNVKGSTIYWYNVPDFSLIRKIQFVDNNTGFLTNDKGTFLITNNGGWSWRELERGKEMKNGYPIENFYMNDQANGWIFCQNTFGSLYNVFSNQPLSIRMSNIYYVQSINAIYFVNPDNGWAVGPGGTILKYTGNTITYYFEKDKNYIGIYPNPVNETGAYINFRLRQTQYVHMDIYNSIGQKVQNIFNGFLSEGNKTLSWMPKNIASGVYFMVVKCDEFTQIKKCIYFH